MATIILQKDTQRANGTTFHNQKSINGSTDKLTLFIIFQKMFTAQNISHEIGIILYFAWLFVSMQIKHKEWVFKMKLFSFVILWWNVSHKPHN